MTEAFHNHLIIKVIKGFPTEMKIHKSLLKRIINNFMSNSLKHTTNGTVQLVFSIIPSHNLVDFDTF